MSTPDRMPLAEEERADLLALLRELTPAQWDAPSLCDSWRVRDVATHIVSYDELSKAATVATFRPSALLMSWKWMVSSAPRCLPEATPEG